MNMLQKKINKNHNQKKFNHDSSRKYFTRLLQTRNFSYELKNNYNKAQDTSQSSILNYQFNDRAGLKKKIHII